MNTPQNPVPADSEISGGIAPPQLPGQAVPQTTKPRQIPGGGGAGTVPGGSGAGETPGPSMGFDPTSNGASTLPGAETLGAAPVTSDTMANPTITNDSGYANPRVSAIATEILQHNPGLPPAEAHRLATLAFQRYLTREAGWEHNPLAVVAARDLDPDPMQGRSEPLPPRGPQEPSERQQDSPGGQEWYHQQGETSRNLANGVVHAEDSLWDRMTGGHEAHLGGLA